MIHIFVGVSSELRRRGRTGVNVMKLVERVTCNPSWEQQVIQIEVTITTSTSIVVLLPHGKLPINMVGLLL